MNETTYALEWRGATKTGYSYADIESGLAAGELHSLYKINVNGKWVVLRDFVEQQRALPVAPPVTIQTQQPPAPQADSLPRPAQTLPSTSLLRPARSFSRPPATITAPQTPVWFWPVIILATTVGLLLLIVLAYKTATSSSRGQRTGSSTSDASPPTSIVKVTQAGDVRRDKPAPSPTSVRSLTNEEIAELKSPFVVTISTVWKEPDKAGKLENAGQSGSGVHIKNENGHAYFVTNRHVVAVPKNAKEVEYSLVFNGHELPFEIVKRGRYELDLAMLRVKYPSGADKPTLPSVRLDDLKPGQECVAIGNALGGGISVTTGVISAFDEWPGGRLVRTSAPISSGNSGGGLFRTKDGALIGITTMVVNGDKSEAVQNFNLAIPMDYVFSDLFWEDF
jgi:S1-C subfamily serine protease